MRYAFVLYRTESVSLSQGRLAPSPSPCRVMSCRTVHLFGIDPIDIQIVLSYQMHFPASTALILF